DAVVRYVPGPPLTELIVTAPASDRGSYGLNIHPDTNPELTLPITLEQLAFGNGPITAGSADCHGNFLLNSVTCAPGPFGQLQLRLENTGPDNVRYVNHAGKLDGSEPEHLCEPPQPHPIVSIEAIL